MAAVINASLSALTISAPDYQTLEFFWTLRRLAKIQMRLGLFEPKEGQIFFDASRHAAALGSATTNRGRRSAYRAHRCAHTALLPWNRTHRDGRSCALRMPETRQKKGIVAWRTGTDLSGTIGIVEDDREIEAGIFMDFDHFERKSSFP